MIGRARDFSVSGVDGVFSLDHGALGFVAGGSIAAVPEPQTYALLGAGLLLIGAIARRRRSAAATTPPARSARAARAP